MRINFHTIVVCLSLVLAGLTSCAQVRSKITSLQVQKDLIPEGIAIDGSAKTVYLNSLNHHKIVSSSLDGDTHKTFLEPNTYGYLAGFGMTVKGDTLYALGNSLTATKNKSVLLLLQLSSGELIDSYSIDDPGFHYLNDLAISAKNEIFITDSGSSKIFKIQRPNKTIEIFLDSENIPNSNGITISDSDTYLYLASERGVAIVEIKSKKLINNPKEEFSSIDGLKFHKNNLYGIVNGWVDQSQNGLFKFMLNDTQTKITSSERLVEFTDEFKIPTTFDIFKGHMYFVMNTQLNNFDSNSNRIIDSTMLEPYKLMKVKVK